jgi:hypothetical protein
VFALRWVFSSDPDQKQGLRGFALGLLGCAFLLTALLHTPGDWLKVYCDSVSLPHLVAIAISGLGVTWLLLLDPAKRWVRLGGLAVIGLAAAAAYHAFPPGCTLDAFSQLEPNVRTLWYERTLEGLPVWRLPTVLASSTIGFPIVGVLCSALACKWSSPESRPMWATYCFLMVSALCVALMVQRAGALANAMAAPAAAWALVGAINALKDSRSALVRVLGLTFVAFALSPLGPVSAVAAFSKPDPDAVQRNASRGGRSCTTTEQIKALSALPAARVFAPLDLGPTILLNTPHAPVASGHHRNHVAMNDVITAFVSDDDAAHAIIRRRATPFVLMCADTAEVQLYAKHAPNGFAAHLIHGQAPKWLEPVPVKGSSLRVWRVIS